MPRLARGIPKFFESAIAGALQQQEELGGPFLRTLSEPLYESLQPNPMDVMNLGTPLPVGMFRSDIYQAITKGYPNLDKSAVANMLRRFSMETLDPLREVGVVPHETLRKMAGRELQGTRFSPELASPQVSTLLRKSGQGKKPIEYNQPSIVVRSAFRGEPSIYLSAGNVEPLQVLGHELGHGMREQAGAKYPLDLSFEVNPEEVVVDALGHLASGKSRQSTIARLLERFWLPEKTIYDAVGEAEMTIQRARSGIKPVRYETLPERKSIERRAEKLGGPRRKNPRERE